MLSFDTLVVFFGLVFMKDVMEKIVHKKRDDFQYRKNERSQLFIEPMRAGYVLQTKIQTIFCRFPLLQTCVSIKRRKLRIKAIYFRKFKRSKKNTFKNKKKQFLKIASILIHGVRKK